MTRERWQDAITVKAARAHYLNVRMHADICADVQATCEDAETVDAETLQTARNNALFAEAKAHEALDALCESVAACVDASPSETTGGEVAAWRVEDRIGLGPELLERWLDKTPAEVEALLNAKEPCDAPYTVRPLYSAPPAGDGVPEVWEEDVALVERMSRESILHGEKYKRIAAALSYCATRQGEGR